MPEGTKLWCTMRRAFTVVELLVVIGIIAALAGILLPSLAGARRQAQRVTCRAQLRDLGASFVMYLTDSKGKLPAINPMPSVRPLINDAPSIGQLLRPYIRTATTVLRCPSDRITKVTPNAPIGADTYFDREGSSYQYNPFLVPFAGRRIQETPAYTMGHREILTVLDEYEAYHGKPGTRGAMNHLFGDMHVGSVGE